MTGPLVTPDRDMLATAIRGGREPEKQQPYEVLPSVVAADRLLASGAVTTLADALRKLADHIDTEAGQ